LWNPQPLIYATISFRTDVEIKPASSLLARASPKVIIVIPGVGERSNDFTIMKFFAFGSDEIKRQFLALVSDAKYKPALPAAQTNPVLITIRARISD
jgi:hypothetical protein